MFYCVLNELCKLRTFINELVLVKIRCHRNCNELIILYCYEVVIAIVKCKLLFLLS